MRILHIIGSLGSGGAEKLIVDIVPEQARKGNIVDVALLNGCNTPFKIKLANSNCCKIFDLSKGQIYNPILIFKLIPLMKGYDLIHAHLFPAQYLVVFAKIFGRCQCSLVFTEHSTFNTRMKYWLLRIFDQFIYRYYSSIICITEEVKQVLKIKYKLPERKLNIINNGIDLEMAESSSAHHRVDFGFNQADILIIMVAAFRESKDHNSLINALALLPDKYKLILIGQGNTISQIKDLIARLKLQSRVSFLGVRTDIYKILKMCDIGVLSSKWEGFGIASIEYMACGLPTIVSEVPGLSNVVGDAALKFEVGDSERLAKLIKLISENKYEYDQLIRRGNEQAQRYSLVSMVEKQIDLYKGVVNGLPVM